tara:strand:- start:388 stop:1047 length:660 start_codon:yes stop_codon:yes gene_type:complete
MIELKNIYLTIKNSSFETDILEGINFYAAKGEALCLIGPSGSGKSSLISIMGGLEKPTKGSVIINKRDITLFNETELARFRKENIGIVFQSFHLLPNLTALENVALPLHLLNTPQAETLSIEALSKVGLESRAGHLPSQLSGGEQQRVALARAFIGKPKIILADEPTGNLDSKSSSVVIDTLFSLKKQQETTLIFATHDEKLSSKCDRVTEIKDGKISQ